MPGRDSVEQDLRAIIDGPWRTVVEADYTVAGISSFIIGRTDCFLFTRLFSQLQKRVNEMASPVMTARTGGICP
jgi:hypothetical protein